MKLNKLKVCFSALLSVFLLAGCSDDDKLSRPNYVSFGKRTNQRLEMLEEDLTITKTFEVFANTISTTDRTFEIVVNEKLGPNGAPLYTTANASHYTFSPTVTIPANSDRGEFTVTSKADAKGKAIGFDIVEQSGVSAGKTLLVRVVEICDPSVRTVTLDLFADAYGAETTWELYNSDLELIYSGGPYGNLTAAGIQQKSHDLCLVPGTYTFLIMDVYSDGICCGAGNGYYTIGVNTNDGIINLVNGAGDFGQFAQTEFTVE